VVPIPEAQLSTWTHHGATGPSKETYREVRRVLTDARAPFPVNDTTVFLQGSYWNDTNVWGTDTDVDVVIRLDNVYYSDLQYLPPEDTTRYNSAFSPAAYDLPEFKENVIKWLSLNFRGVTPGKKAIFIPGDNTRRDADVLVCTEFRRYHSFQTHSNGYFDSGILFTTSSGARIDNFPKQHADNCSAKHQNTGSNFKPMVRIFKNIRNRLVREGIIRDDLAPSYHIEGLLYNVPNAKFYGNYANMVEQCLSEIWSADRTKYLAANEMYFLLWDYSNVCWNQADCTAFISAAIDLWNDW
jgi:hypothetical protein